MGGGGAVAEAMRAHILTPNTWHVPHVSSQNYKELFCLYKEKKHKEVIQSARITLWTAVNQVVNGNPGLKG